MIRIKALASHVVHRLKTFSMYYSLSCILHMYKYIRKFYSHPIRHAYKYSKYNQNNYLEKVFKQRHQPCMCVCDRRSEISNLKHICCWINAELIMWMIWLVTIQPFIILELYFRCKQIVTSVRISPLAVLKFLHCYLIWKRNVN